MLMARRFSHALKILNVSYHDDYNALYHRVVMCAKYEFNS